MDGYHYGPSSYGDAFADVYDEWYADDARTRAAVDFLAGHAGGGPVLELGVGSGRLAIPLAGRGLDVWGVDASPAMLGRLRDKPGGDRVTTVLGDMAAPDLGDGHHTRFTLVFIAENTLFNLVSVDDQVRCLRHARTRLAPGGSVIVEAFVPVEADERAEPHVDATVLERDRLVLRLSRHEPINQVVTGHHIELSGPGVRLRPWVVHYAAPDQLDAMAGEAGLRLVARYGGWEREPFDQASDVHVSVYAAG